MNTKIHIAIAEPSVIIRGGIINLLRQIRDADIYIIEIPDITQLEFMLCRYKSDVLIINPALMGYHAIHQIKHSPDLSQIRYVALHNALADPLTLGIFDENITIYDSAEQIKTKIVKLCHAEQSFEVKQELSVREKEIIVEVVKGLINKQIAEKLCLSVHTVITHRRNIANKLQIHSPAGLTVYAILNKLVRLEDIKN